LLQSGKRVASAAFRRESTSRNDDSFCSENSASESEIVSHLLGNIKFLLRRKAAAVAALDAGLYSESARHFSKILDGRRGTPQGFISECYMLRATAYQAAGRVTDSIADCNRTLALDPTCIEALTTRGTLFETARCFSESLQDLEHLRLLYESILRQQKFPGPVWKHQKLNYRDIHGNLQFLNSKILTMKQRLTSPCTIDYYTLIGLRRGCTRADVERAHLLLCLRHRPDKASHFVDRCEFVDERDIDAVKDQARLSALMLYRLLQKAYTYIMTSIMEEEAEKQKQLRASEIKWEEPDGQVAREAKQCLQVRSEPSIDVKVDFKQPDRCTESEASNTSATSSGSNKNVVNGELQQISLARSLMTDRTSMDTTSGVADVPRINDTSEFSIYTSVKEDSSLQELADTSVFQAVSCRDLVAVGTMLSHGFPSDGWLNHQGHAIRSLPVTYEALSC
jgi:tetratricopeptide (TPR) repeat protein